MKKAGPPGRPAFFDVRSNLRGLRWHQTLVGIERSRPRGHRMLATLFGLQYEIQGQGITGLPGEVDCLKMSGMQG